MITIEDLENKAFELYPNSEEQRNSFIIGCKYIVKLVFDREYNKKEEVRNKNEIFYMGFTNAIDGILKFLIPIKE